MDIKTLFTQNRKQFIFYVIGVLLITPTNIMFTFAMANAFNIFEVTSSLEVIKIVLISVSLGFSPIILQLISRFLRIGFMRDVLVLVRMLAYEKLLSKSPSEFSKGSKESYQSQLVSDINLFENDFFLAILNIIYGFGNFLLGIIVLLFISPFIALATTITAILLFILTKVFEKPTKIRKQQVLAANSIFHQKLSNILHGLETIKLYQVISKFKTTFYQDVFALEKDKQASYQINLVQRNIMSWIAGSFQLFIIIYAAYLFSKGEIILTSLVATVNLVGQLTWGMNNSLSMVNRYKTSVDIFYSITQYDKRAPLSDKFTLNKEITVENLSYAYSSEEVLSNINLNIKKGDKVLIYGPTGFGKTTLINLLSQNLKDYQGKIFYDDVELSKVDPKSFNDNIGYVRQEHFIFDDSIKNNIILNQPFVEKKFKDVLVAADIATWIASLELKEDHVLLNNGSNISGGQRQRINIARELYQDKQVIIFDEPSSSLDDETSKNIYQTIENLDKTVIVISHRHIDYLSKSFDQVIDLERLKGEESE